MASTLDSCEEFIQTLAELDLLSAPDMTKLRAFRQAGRVNGPRELHNFLVDHDLLTRFQADALLKGAARALVFPPYTILSVIGTGSMGTVYKAKSAEDDGFYAIKTVPRKNVSNLKAIAEKVAILKDVRHPRVSAMVHVGINSDRVYMVWPFIDGGTKLEDLVSQQGRLAPRLAAQIALQTASGLQAYHAHGLFHGLLKASDILIGSDRRVRILNFGVGFLLTNERGKSLLSTTTNTKALSRGLDCASPESIADPLDRTIWGDQYSLGCLLYLCLTGQFPFPDKNPVKKMLGHQAEEPTPVKELAPDCPNRLVNIVNRMLEKNPQDRYETTDELIQELQGITSDSRNGAAFRPSTPGSRDGTGLRSSPSGSRDGSELRPSSETLPGSIRSARTPEPKLRPAKQEHSEEEMVPNPDASLSASRGSSVKMISLLTLAGVLGGLVAGVLTWLLTR